MYYEIRGGSRRQKKLAESALWFAKNELLPRIKNLDIDLSIGKYILDGSVVSGDDREFFIEIKRDLPDDELATAIFHEFVHVKQHIRKEILDCDFKLPYREQPHEIEAYKLEVELFEKFKNL